MRMGWLVEYSGASCAPIKPQIIPFWFSNWSRLYHCHCLCHYYHCLCICLLVVGPVVNQQWLKNSPSDCQIGKPRCVFLPPSESTISPSSDAQWTSLSFQPSHCMADTSSSADTLRQGVSFCRNSSFLKFSTKFIDQYSYSNIFCKLMEANCW